MKLVNNKQIKKETNNMSENTTAPAVSETAPVLTDEQIIAASPFANGFSVTRNGITKPFEICVGTRSVWKGVPYPAPQVQAAPVGAGESEADSIKNDTLLISDLAFLGKDNVKKMLNVVLRRNAQDLVEDAIPETGEDAGKVNIPLLINSWEKLQAASLKLSELVEQWQAASAKMQAATPKFIQDMQTLDDAGKAKAAAEFQALSNNVTALKAEYEIRKAKRSKEAATETVSPN